MCYLAELGFNCVSYRHNLSREDQKQMEILSGSIYLVKIQYTYTGYNDGMRDRSISEQYHMTSVS